MWLSAASVSLKLQFVGNASFGVHSPSSPTEPAFPQALQTPRHEEMMLEGTVRSEEVADIRFVKTEEDGLELQKKAVCAHEVRG